MATREQIQSNVSRAIQTLDPLDIMLLSQILDVGGDSMTYDEMRESLRISYEELDAISDRAIHRFVEALDSDGSACASSTFH